MTEEHMRVFITTRIMSRLSLPGERRNEALREVLEVSVPGLDTTTIANAVSLAPNLPASCYTKWAEMFAARLLETVPHEQLTELCANTQESNATLLLLYCMFMESERMEQVVAEDIANLTDAPETPAH